MILIIGEFEYLLITAAARLGEDAYGAAIRREIEETRLVKRNFRANLQNTYRHISTDEQSEGIMKRVKPQNASMMCFLNAKNLPTIFAIITMHLCITPALFAQRDVHASLIATTNRKPAPSFRLISETGKIEQLSDYHGKVVLLNFWATDCGGCVLEIPSIIGIQAGYENKGFTVVGISMDIPYENLKDADEAWSKVKPFIAKKQINYPILMGSESQFKDFGLTQLPDTLLIDKSGRIAAVYVGIISTDSVETNIKKLLSE